MVLYISIWASLAAFMQSMEWELSIDRDGIQVFTRESDRTLNDSKAITILKDVTLEEIEQEFKSFDDHKEWINTVYDSRQIGTSEKGPIVHYKADAPWPVSNRDIVSQITIRRLEGELQFNNYALPEYIPKEEDLVRVPVSTNSWRFRELPDDRIEVTFLSQTDPGGSLPNWLVRMGSSDSPYQTLKGFRDRFN